MRTGAVIILATGLGGKALAQDTKGPRSPMTSASDTFKPEAFELSKLETSDLQPADIERLKDEAMLRFTENVNETSLKIPDETERRAFLRLQDAHLLELQRTRDSMYIATPDSIRSLASWAAPQLRELHAKMSEKGTGLFIDAGARGQTLHLVRREGDSLRFLFAARITSGEDGVSPETDPSSNMTKSGLLSVLEVVKDHVVPGEDVSWEKRHIDGQHTFTITSKTGPKIMYIAPVGFANVGLIAFRLFKGQALHQGPLRKGPASHGCTRADGIVVATLDRFIVKGTPVMIAAPTSEQERILAVKDVRTVATVAREHRPESTPKPRRAARQDPIKEIFDFRKIEGGQ